MGIAARAAERRRASPALVGVAVLALVIQSSSPVHATVYGYDYASALSTVRSLPVSFVAGTAGTSALSAVAANAATGTVTAGLSFYVDATAPTSATPITVDTSLAQPATSNSFTFNKATIYLWSPQYTAATTLYAGTWTLDLFVGANKANPLTVTITTVTSTGALSSTIATGVSTPSIGALSEVIVPITGAAGSVPANGYILVTLTAPTPGNPLFTLYWGTGQASSFQSPSLYDYVLSVSNPAGSSWSVSMGVASSSGTSRLVNMTVFLKAPDVSPYTVYSQQVAMGSGVTQKLSGTPVTWSSANLYIYVAATANAFGTGTVYLSLELQPTSTTPYTLYTIGLTVG